MTYCDNQTSVWIFTSVLGFLMRQCLKNVLFLYSGGTGEEGIYSSGPFKKSLILQ